MRKYLLKIVSFMLAIVPGYLISNWVQQLSISSSLREYPSCYPAPSIGGRCTDTQAGGLFLVLLPITIISFYFLINYILGKYIR